MFRGILVLVTGACSESLEAVYDSMEDAVEAGAVGNHSWIPAFLPPSTVDIQELHNLDTNEGWLRFKYSPEDHDILTEALEPTSLAQFEASGFRSPGVDWWDVERLLEPSANREELELYARIDRQENEAGREFVARRFVLLVPTEGEGYVWLKER